MFPALIRLNNHRNAFTAARTRHRALQRPLLHPYNHFTQGAVAESSRIRPSCRTAAKRTADESARCTPWPVPRAWPAIRPGPFPYYQRLLAARSHLFDRLTRARSRCQDKLMWPAQEPSLTRRTRGGTRLAYPAPWINSQSAGHSPANTLEIHYLHAPLWHQLEQHSPSVVHNSPLARHAQSASAPSVNPSQSLSRASAQSVSYDGGVPQSAGQLH